MHLFRMAVVAAFALWFTAVSTLGAAQDTRSGTALAAVHVRIPSARERLEIRKAIVREKLARAVLPAMRAHGFDLWITIDRENQADPLHDDFGAPYSGAAAAFFFFDRGGPEVEAIFLGSAQPADSPVAHVYGVKEYSGNSAEDVKRLIADAVAHRAPKRIGINSSASAGAADGLTSAFARFLAEALGPDLSARMSSAEAVAHAFRANRTPLETEWYRKLQQWTDRLETDALVAVKPGHTTALDLACAIEDAAYGSGLTMSSDHGRYPMIVWFGDRGAMAGVTSFGPARSLRPGATDLRDFPLLPGDLITVDGGVRLLGFATDMKRTAYLLKPGETAAPASLQKAWRDTRAVADRYARRMVPGATGDQVFTGLMEEIRGLGFEPAGSSPVQGAAARPQVSVYGHSTGNVVHDLGPRVSAAAVPGPSLAVQQGEWVSIEFHLLTPSPEAPGGAWFTRFEQTAQVGPQGAVWLVPPQDALLLIPAPSGTSKGAAR